jgi:hypothetical protein
VQGRRPYTLDTGRRVGRPKKGVALLAERSAAFSAVLVMPTSALGS